MIRRKCYKNIKTGKFGIIEAENLLTFLNKGRYSEYGVLRLFEAVNGMVQLGDKEERVLLQDLVEVSLEEVERHLLSF